MSKELDKLFRAHARESYYISRDDIRARDTTGARRRARQFLRAPQSQRETRLGADARRARRTRVLEYHSMPKFTAPTRRRIAPAREAPALSAPGRHHRPRVDDGDDAGFLVKPLTRALFISLLLTLLVLCDYARRWLGYKAII